MGSHQSAPLKSEYRPCSVMQCLHCGADLNIDTKEDRQSIACTNCNATYPVLLVGSIYLPLIFEDTDAVLYGWCARLNGFRENIDQEISSLASQLKNKRNSKLTCKRLKNHLSAKKQYRDQLSRLLASIDNHSSDNQLITNNSLAKNQGVDSYINNIFRDWCWENEENLELLNAVEQVMPENYSAGNTLTLGAGASRLSYDFHFAFNADHSILTDINPVLLGAAANIINEVPMELFEFPVAPTSIDSFAVKQQCQLPNNYKHDVGDFEFILADALNSPLKKSSIDTLLTPWFIDILPVNFVDFIPHVNRLLKVGGNWINTGSLAFFHNDPSWNYSQEEVIDLLKKYGFADINFSRTEISYLNSPYSSHGRSENIFSFSAIKKFDTKIPEKFNYIPGWMRDLDKEIPSRDEITAISSKYLLQAQVLSAVDGKRSIAQISEMVARQYGISEENARAAVRQIFQDNIS